MFTYRVRTRRLKLQQGATSIAFPAACAINFHMLPKQPFGMESGGGRTTTRAQGASVIFNANTGIHYVQSKSPLAPLDVTIVEDARTIKVAGNVVTISQRVSSLQEMDVLVNSIYFVLPISLNVDIADPPYVERVDGTIGETTFSWELDRWQLSIFPRTQEEQEESIVTAWSRIDAITPEGRRRLAAALHYFHVAVRLDRAGATPGEFMPEALLNFSKVLEVLFPTQKNEETRDAARRGLKSLGYDKSAIDRDFIPAMALRNEVGVGHVDLKLFTMEQLQAIHDYMGKAEAAFRELLERATERTKAGTWEPETYKLHPLPPRILSLLERLGWQRPPAL